MLGLVSVLPGLGSAAGNQAAPPEALRDASIPALTQGAKTLSETELTSFSLFGVIGSPDSGRAAWHHSPSPADRGCLPEALTPGLPCLRAEVPTAKSLQQTRPAGLAWCHGPRERGPGFVYPAQNPGRVVLI